MWLLVGVWENVRDGCAAFLVFRVGSERILKGKGTPRRWGRMEGKDYVMEDGDVEQSRAFACSGRPAPFVVRAVVTCDNLRSSGPEGVEIVDYH